MKNVIAILLLLACSMTQMNAQETAPVAPLKTIQPIEYNNKIGFAGSMFSGYGFSYEYDVSRDITLELTAAVFGQGGSSTNSTYDYSNPFLTIVLGTEFQKNFYRSANSRFYGLIGIGYWIDNTTYSYNNNTYRNKNDYTGGLGLGWEFTYLKRFVFNIEGGYVYRDMNTKSNNINNQVISTHSYYLGFGIGAGIYYAF